MTYTNYLLVESVRTPRGPRQRVICSLGDLCPRPAQEWLALARHLEAALLGQLELSPSQDPEVLAPAAKARDATSALPTALPGSAKNTANIEDSERVVNSDYQLVGSTKPGTIGA